MLEDACQALGAHDSTGKKIGTDGKPRHVRLLRQQADDHGGGGVLVTPDEEVAEHVKSERNQGRAPDMDQVEHDRLGFNYRLTDLHAAIGIAQLERLDEMLNARENVAALYRERLTQLGAAPAGDQADHESRPALREPGRRATQLVRLLRPAAGGSRS